YGRISCRCGQVLEPARRQALISDIWLMKNPAHKAGFFCIRNRESGSRGGIFLIDFARLRPRLNRPGLHFMTSTARKIDLDPSWLAHLASEFDKPYMKQLKAFLLQQKQQGKVIFPPRSEERRVGKD